MILAPRGRGPKDDYRRRYSLARCSAGIPVPWIRYRTVRDTSEGAADTRDVRCDAPGDKKHEADGLHVRLLGPDCFRRRSSLVPLSVGEVSRTGESFLHGRVDPVSRTCWTPCFSLLDGPHSPFCLGSFSVDVATVHILPLPGPCHVSLVFSDGSKASPSPFPPSLPLSRTFRIHLSPTVRGSVSQSDRCSSHDPRGKGGCSRSRSPPPDGHDPPSSEYHALSHPSTARFLVLSPRREACGAEGGSVSLGSRGGGHRG